MKKYNSLRDIPFRVRPTAKQSERAKSVDKIDSRAKIIRAKKGRRTISLGVHPVGDIPGVVKGFRLQNRGLAFQVILLEPSTRQNVARTYFAKADTTLPESLTLKLISKYRLSDSFLVYVVVFERVAKPAKKAAKKPAKKTVKKTVKKAAKKPAKKAAKKTTKKEINQAVAEAKRALKASRKRSKRTAKIAEALKRSSKARRNRESLLDRIRQANERLKKAGAKAPKGTDPFDTKIDWEKVLGITNV